MIDSEKDTKKHGKPVEQQVKPAVASKMPSTFDLAKSFSLTATALPSQKTILENSANSD